MPLTAPQMATLKTWLLANAVGMDDSTAAGALNGAATPAFYVYETDVPVEEIMLNGFDWTRVDNLSIGKARIWEWMTTANSDRAINPSKPNIRAGINATWVGTAADLLVRDAVYAHCYRKSTVAEKLLATGTGTAPVADGSGPAVSNYVEPITVLDVEFMRTRI